jgi:defect-in-organelle-trafficking protein DotB
MMTDTPLKKFKLPASATIEDFDAIFSKLHGLVSDLFLQPDYPIMARYRGRILPVTDSPVTKKSMDDLLEKMVSQVKASLIKKGEPQGWSHRIQKKTEKTGLGDLTQDTGVLRFRCNSKSVQTKFSQEEFQLVMRPTLESAWEIDRLKLDQALVDGLFPESGMVLFSGPTGSGKTTTLAACIKKILFDPNGKVVTTIEDPVEFNHHGLEGITGVLTHCEIGRNVNSYPLAMRAALRENPDVIMTGEMRDEESMLIAIEASQTGHALYSTLHANSVTSVFVRVAQKLSPERMEANLATFIESSRTFVFQRLFPSLNGGMVALVEYVVLTGEDRIDLNKALNTGGVAAVTRTMNEIMTRSGKTYIQAAQEALERKDLSVADFESIVRTYKLSVATEQLI